MWKFPNLLELVQMHNKARAEYYWGKLSELQVDESLTKYANDWALHMSNTNMYHSNMKDIMKLGFSSVAENIAYGTSDVSTVFNQWMNSYGHRRNILCTSCNYIGCGFAYSERSIPYWCVCFGRKK